MPKPPKDTFSSPHEIFQNLDGRENELATRQIVVFDTQNPASVVSLVSPLVKEKILALPEELRCLTEKEFILKYRPGAEQNRIRVSFWSEYAASRLDNIPMNMERVFSRHCTTDYFYTKYITRPEFIAWLIIPPTDYETAVEEALYTGMDKLRDILDLPIQDPVTQKINFKVIDSIIKVTLMLDMRMKGMYLQRSEVKNLNLNVSRVAQDVGNTVAALTMSDLDKKILALEAQMRKEKGLPTLARERFEERQEEKFKNARMLEEAEKKEQEEEIKAYRAAVAELKSRQNEAIEGGEWEDVPPKKGPGKE